MKKTKTDSKKRKENKDQASYLLEKVASLEQKWKRALADYDNLEKRFASDKQSLAKYLNAGLIEKLLVVLDDLQRANVHIKDKGLVMIINKFIGILTAEGVEEISAKDKVFDPETMDCVDLVKGPNNIVIDIMQKGYMIHGRVLRPVKVKVGKGGPPLHKASEDK